MLNNFEESFKEGLIELLYQDPNMGSLARGMGKPIIDNSTNTASLKWDKQNKKMVFIANEDFIESVSTEMVASVVLHATEHLIFDHIQERIDGNFPNKEVLHLAQECISNDIISDVYQLPLPDGAITGNDLLNINCSALSTRQVYDLLMQQEPPGEENGGGSPNQSSGNEGFNEESSGDGKPKDGKSGDGKPHSHGCGDIEIDDNDILDLEDYLKDLVEGAAKENNKTVEEFLQEIDNTNSGGYSPTGANLTSANQITPARMNWKYLLSKINPKVMESGKKTKIKYDWTKQNRRLISVFPRAIIPKVNTKDPKPTDKGDSIPVLVIALDLSGSIPRSLVGMLQGLLEDIPENLIKAYPCTWGTYLYPYVPGGTVASGTTDIHRVSNYVQQIEEETGTSPYVLVITDGDFTTVFPRPGKDWYFMAIDNNSYIRCKRHSGDDEHLYHVKDFKTV